MPSCRSVPDSGQELEGLAEALYLEREYSAAAAALRARLRGLPHGAATEMAAGRAARSAAWITGNVLGDWAVQNGWLARARTILEEAGEDRPERGWVLIIRSISEPDAGGAGGDASRGDRRRAVGSVIPTSSSRRSGISAGCSS